MPHIQLPEGLPGIRGLMAYSPQTAKVLNALAEELLRSENTLSRGEREMIAAYVSSQNDCLFCQSVHGAVASHYLQDDGTLMSQVRENYHEAPVSEKMKALLTIAGSVQKGGKEVMPAQVEKARAVGASDKEIHDTVLIAAAFCMFNRYVDGLATWAPADPQVYKQRSAQVAQTGYARSDPYQ